MCCIIAAISPGSYLFLHTNIVQARFAEVGVHFI